MTYKEISRITGVKEMTVVSIIRRFIENGHRFIQYRPKFGKLPPLVKEYILNPNTLKEQQSMSLLKRCRSIRFKHNIQVSTTFLRLFYKNNGVTYRKISYVKKSKSTKRDREKSQFLHEIMSARDLKKDLLYIDQTTFNQWHGKAKTWQPNYAELQFYQTDNKTQNFTLYGAISEKYSQFIYSIQDNTSIDSFKSFLSTFLETYKGKLSQLVMVMDNHSSHKSKIIKDILAALEIQIIFVPAYSSELNPIELLWNTIKAEWKIKVLDNNGESSMDQDQCKAVVTSICQNNEWNNLPKLIKSVDRYLLEIALQCKKDIRDAEDLMQTD